MSDAPVSVQLYSVRDAIASDLGGALDRIASLGFRNVEPYGFVDDAADYADALSSRGLTALSAHAPFLDGGDVARALDAAAQLGVSTLIDPFIPSDKWRTADDVARIADLINAASAQAAPYGFAIGYHNHQWELATVIDGVPALELFAAKLDPAVVLEVDTYWAEVGGVSAPDLLNRLGSRVALIHVKDGYRDGDTSRQQPAGSGEIPVPAILAAAPSAVRVIEFDDYSGDVFDGLAASLDYVEAAS
ncbi:sugar phosphate isomerase/epimerase family protein [Amnibacterium flavum]|uniref:Sugar phosphate isomerase/epimerase n=1 Tax=Amnibacterium flavum TaxID=2173173 RepID=A0A2V1HXH7_9MICO|nr:sugar phosphate isomerase/epimerase [Amnibacterium flavum]PVZ96000.1 sugar phosphate isomerase/epimerase [Amnibacterium flavum]